MFSQACSKLFHSTLQLVKDKIEPVLTTNLYQESPETTKQSEIKVEKQDSKSDSAKKEKDKDHETRWESTNSTDKNSVSSKIKSESIEIKEQ